MSADAIIRVGGNTIRVTQRGGQGPRGFNGPDLIELAGPTGASLVGAEDGATLQQAIAVADDPASLLASTIALPEGAKIRTANGYIYEVAPAAASDHHLTTAGGVKLYALPIDGCIYAEAFGVATGDWATDAAGDKIDSTTALQAAINAMSSRMTLVLPSGTIYTGNLTAPYGVISISFRGQGTFSPTTVIQFLDGATAGFQLEQEAYEFQNIQFRGVGNVSGAALFTSTRSDNLVDMDWSFHNCSFNETFNVGRMLGRGLTVDRCVFGSIYSDAFVLNYPPVGSVIPSPAGYMGTVEGGFRGFTVRNSRIHGITGYMFRVNGENAANARGFTITGNQWDILPRVIKGYAQEVAFTGNNCYVGSNAGVGTTFDLVSFQNLNIVGNVISNSGQFRLAGSHALVRATASFLGLTITGNSFRRRDVPVLDAALGAGNTARDIVIADNTYDDCFVNAPCLARIVGATAFVYNAKIVETLYESPAGGWTAVVGDGNWRWTEVRITTRQNDTIIHNVPNSYSRNNEPKTGAYVSDGTAKEFFVGYQPKIVRVYKNNGTFASMKLQNSLSGQPPEITFTATGFSITTAANVNTSGSAYYWEAS